MSGAIYEVITKITMVNGVSGVLAVIANDVLRLNVSIKDLTSSLQSFNNTARMVIGGLAIVGGMEGLNAMKTAVEHARDLNHELTQLKKLNLQPADEASARNYATNLPYRVPGTTTAEGLKLFSETYSMFGPANSMKIMDPLARFAQVAGNMSGNYEKAYDNIYSFVRSGELMGKFLDEKTHLVDTEKLTKFLDLGSRVMQATRGKVDAAAWLGLAQQGGPALSMMDEKGLYTMAMLSQAMGGQRAGTALSSAFQQMAGGKMTQYAAQLLHGKYGLLGGYTVQKGGHLTWDPGALETPFVKALEHDPLDAMKMLLDKMGENGLTDMEQIIPELYQMLGRNTTQRMFHDLMRNLPQMLQERERIMKGMGTDQAFNLQNDRDYNQIEHNYEAAKQEMLAQLGLPLMQLAIPVLRRFTDIMLEISKWAEAHPDLLKNLGEGLSAISVGLLAFGSFAVISALTALGTVSAGLLAGLWAAVGAIAFFNWDKLIAGIAAVGAGLNKLLDGMTAWGEALGSWLDGLLTKIGDGLSSLWGKIKGFFGFSNASYTEGGGGFGGGGASGSGAVGAGTGAGLKAVLDAAARKHGIDPRIMYGIVAGESHHGNRYDIGDGGKSFGPFQMYTGGGLGNRIAAAGIDVRDPKTIAAQADWVANFIAHGGSLGNWHGYHGNRDWNPRWGNAGFSPPTKSNAPVQVEANLDVDGHKLAKATTKHIARLHEHPTSSPYFDGTGMFTTPDTQIAT